MRARASRRSGGSASSAVRVCWQARIWMVRQRRVVRTERPPGPEAPSPGRAPSGPSSAAPAPRPSAPLRPARHASSQGAQCSASHAARTTRSAPPAPLRQPSPCERKPPDGDSKPRSRLSAQIRRPPPLTPQLTALQSSEPRPDDKSQGQPCALMSATRRVTPEGQRARCTNSLPSQ